MKTRAPANMISFALFMARVSLATARQRADFEAILVLEPPGCQQTGHCQLGNDFGFVDSQGVAAGGAKGLLTDGASIPLWAQMIG